MNIRSHVWTLLVVALASLVVATDCNIPLKATDKFDLLPFQQELNVALEELDTEISGLFTNSSVVGLYVTVVYNQDVIFSQGYGCSANCAKTGQPIEVPTSKNIFRVGSVTKLFTGMMLMMLRDANQVHLDTQLQALLPELKMPNPFGQETRGISLQMLGSHTAGLQAWAPCRYPCNYTTSEMVELLNSVPLIMPPMSYVHYSNLGLALLGRSLESVTPNGMTYEEYVTLNILQKLDMNQSGFEFTPEVKQQMAVGYNLVGLDFLVPSEEIPNLGWQAPSGQMYSSPDDMAQFMKFLFRDEKPANNSNQPLSGVTIREWLNTVLYQNNIQNVASFGMPWENMLLLDKYLLHCKNGGIAGYGAEICVSPERKLGVITNVNQQPTFGLEKTIARVALEKLIPLFEEWTSSFGSYNIVPGDYEKYLGTYALYDIVYTIEYYFVDSYGSLELVVMQDGEVQWVLEDVNDLFQTPGEFVTRVLPVKGGDCWTFQGGQPVFEYATFKLSAETGYAEAFRMPRSKGNYFFLPKIN